MEVSTIKVYYTLTGVFSFYLIYYLWPRKTKFPKFWGAQRGYHFVLKEYDWDETFRRNKIWMALSVPYLIIFILLLKLFGEWIGKVGLILFAILNLIAAYWTGPVKKVK